MEPSGGMPVDRTQRVYPDVGFTNRRIHPEPRVLAQWIAENCGQLDRQTVIEIELRTLPKKGLWLLHQMWLRTVVGDGSIPDGFCLQALAGVRKAFPVEAGEEPPKVLA